MTEDRGSAAKSSIAVAQRNAGSLVFVDALWVAVIVKVIAPDVWDGATALGGSNWKSLLYGACLAFIRIDLCMALTRSLSSGVPLDQPDASGNDGIATRGKLCRSPGAASQV